MGIEGSLSISLGIDSGRVKRVQISSSRPVHASRVFQGKETAEVLKTLPLLFSICGTAQVCAGVRACEQALGMKAAPQVEQLRDCLVRMENLREQLWRILLEWPEFLGEELDSAAMSNILKLQREYRQAVTNGYDPFLLYADAHDSELLPPHGLIQQIRSMLEQGVFGMPPQKWLDIEHPEMLEAWVESGTTTAACMLDYLFQQEWSDVGKCEIAPLPDLDLEQLNAALSDEDFVRRPQWFGSCRETTSSSRIDSRLLQQLRSRHGNGLLVRLVARLTEIAQLSAGLLPETLNEGEGEDIPAHNPGIGQVAAARGQLVHRVTLDGQRITRYQILAPTEWNFHPQGVVAQALGSVQGSAVQIEQQARLLINMIDPCVGYELTIDA